MKNTFILLCLVFSFSLNAQDLKSLTKSASETTEEVGKTSFIEKFAGDQVKQLARKLSLSDKQQAMVSDLVVSQLKTEKFQNLISGFSPSQLMGSKAQTKIADSLMKSKGFNSGLDKVLSDKQKKMLH
ncbi:MAG: hypothetical protein KGY51_03205 [Psychroflexus sp.]|nr:hypothetical protein [Psychroflexus sp.]